MGKNRYRIILDVMAPDRQTALDFAFATVHSMYDWPEIETCIADFAKVELVGAVAQCDICHHEAISISLMLEHMEQAHSEAQRFSYHTYY